MIVEAVVTGSPFRGEKTESTKHGPPPWIGSMDRVYQNMDQVHGPPIFTSPKITEVNNNKIKITCK